MPESPVSFIDTDPVPCDECGKNVRNPETGEVQAGLLIDSTALSEHGKALWGRLAGLELSFCQECYVGGLIEAIKTSRRKEECRRIVEG